MSKLPLTSPFEWSVVGTVVVTAAPLPGPIDDAVYRGLCEAIDQDGMKLIFSLTTPEAASPTATQRKAAADAMKKRGVTALVITESRLIRGVLTAVGWLGASVSGFSWAELEKALLQVDEQYRPAVREMAEDFRKRVLPK
jgi:hypothetical protein